CRSGGTYTANDITGAAMLSLADGGSPHEAAVLGGIAATVANVIILFIPFPPHPEAAGVRHRNGSQRT
ncbi:MAG: hypothetical protein MJ061_07170, partial [Mailhella sp.]|nr:hypothetical protein [Mailhella sp.]